MEQDREKKFLSVNDLPDHFKWKYERFQIISDHMLDLVAMTDLQGDYKFVSKSHTFMGYELDFLLGKNVLEFVHPADFAYVEFVLQEFKNNEEANRKVEYRYRCADGSYCWLETVGNLINDQEGRTKEIIFSSRDITERKKAEQVLANQLELQKVIAEISAAFINLSTESINESIDQALHLAGNSFNIDRIKVILCSDDEKYVAKAYEYSKPGIEPVLYDLSNIKFENYPWLMKKLKLGETIFIPSVEGLPSEAAFEKSFFQEHLIKSGLIIPILSDNKMLGHIGFGSVSEESFWSDEHVSLLKVVAEIIASALIKQRAEDALRESEKKYREILEFTEDAYYAVDLRGNFTACNRAMEKMLGYNEKELIGLNFRSLCQNSDQIYKVFNQAFEKAKPRFSVIINLIRKDGSNITADLSLSLIYNKEGYIVGFRGLGRDITERMQLEEQLKYLSFQDQLTGLYNRRYFENELDRLDGGREYPVTVISADLDGMKLINDSLGHRKGDQYLKACANLLEENMRSSDILARVSGDEFAIILPRTNQKEANKLISRIRNAIDAYNEVQPDLPISISMGLAVSEKDTQLLEETYSMADSNMYQDKLQRNQQACGNIVKALLAYQDDRKRDGGKENEYKKQLSIKIGQKIGLNDQQMANLIALSEACHLGNVAIPESVFNKQGRLKQDEWEMVRQHSEKGSRIASFSPALNKIADLILYHHENFDGSGYPAGIKGEAIPVECRIMSVVSSFIAMTSYRTYGKVLSNQEAIEELRRCSGNQFDPKLVEVFISCLKDELSLRIEWDR